MSADLKDWATIDLAPFWDGHYEDEVPTLLPLWNGIGAAYVGKINTFMGEPASCKTWAALIACVHEIRQGNGALWIDLEDAPQTVVGRLKNLGVSRDELPLFQYKRPTSKPPQKVTEQALNEATINATRSGGVDPVARLVSQAEPFEALVQEITGCTIVVVDSVTELMSLYGLNGDVREEVSTFHKRLRELFTDHDAGIILLDHVTKSTAGRGRWASGSERKISGLDGSGIAFDVVQKFGRGKVGRIKLSVSKDRPGYLDGELDDGKTIGEMVLTSDAVTGAVSFKVHRHNWLDDVDERSGDSILKDIMKVLTHTPGLGVNEIWSKIDTYPKKKVIEGLALLELKNVVSFSHGSRGKKAYSLIEHTSGSLVRTSQNQSNQSDLTGATGSTPMVEPVNQSTTGFRLEPTAEEIEAYIILQGEWYLDDRAPTEPTADELEALYWGVPV